MNYKRLGGIALFMAVCLLFTACKSPTAMWGENPPLTIHVWHYYSGPQQQAFQELVREYNETMGVEKNVAVYAKSFGGINELVNALNDAVDKKVGAEEVPQIFASYADTAYALNKKGVVADISPYFTSEELENYSTDFLEEGRFQENSLKILPVAKSTEVLAINQSDWDTFAQATGASSDGFATWEGITHLAEQYYQYTDSLTPEPDDGKAMFGRDAFANYILIGAKQLGKEVFQVEQGKVEFVLDDTVMRKLWDNYYIPMVHGWFAESGKFRSDDMKTGTVISLVCSTSGSAFLPKEVSDDLGASKPIEVTILPLPNFEGTQPHAVQQGAGMLVSSGSPEVEKAAVEFLKWFTQPEQNIRFSLQSGYLPVVKMQENQMDTIVAEQQASGEVSLNDNLWKSLEAAGGMLENYRLYTNAPFEHGYEARDVVNTAMHRFIKEDMEKIETTMAEGKTREEAIALLDVEARYQAWVQEMQTALENTKTIA